MGTTRPLRQQAVMHAVTRQASTNSMILRLCSGWQKFKKAVFDGQVETVAKLMGALQEKPEMLAKLVMWADDRTGANLLHWCGFYGKEAHAVLARTFMMVPGVNASVPDNHQHTPCYIACKQNHPDVLE